jgi:4-amino-4-deoxy-L-arabinose transferase-like glycosyltransferase
MTNRTRTDWLLMAGSCAFLFLFGLGQFGLIGADEPRYAQVAREMLERRDWVTPVLGGQPWLEKPPLYYWQAMLAYRLFGVSDWAARLPSALDAVLMVLAVYLFLRRFRPGFEVDGALMTASCAAVIGYARAASMDMPLAAAFTIAMLSWWAWRESGRKLYLAWFYAFVALGMLAKGPVAPFLAALVIVGYAAAARELRLILRMLWAPGILLFCAIALPWYVLAQWRNPEFFRVFILQHNLARFSTDLYHHTEPAWYYFPIALLGLVPWTVFIIAALTETTRNWWAGRNTTPPQAQSSSPPANSLAVFLACWLIAPVLFFSISQSKLPGYILPVFPAGALLLAEYLRRHLTRKEQPPVSKLGVALHSLFAAAPIVPALLIQYLVTQHRLPAGRPLLTAVAVAFLLSGGIAMTLVSRFGLRMLRFVTLIPVVLAVAAVLKIGAAALDENLSARPVALQLSSIETHALPLAVHRVPRELEYGLTFYRNRLTVRYEWGSVPGEHLLVVPENSWKDVVEHTAGRRILLLGNFAPQHLDYYWVSAPGAASQP